ncbi:MAG: hypothetical protein A2015_03855 [Spirochaetes bacterium GWF1_31_7]|nr:MAG: hypothetical protein A2Y30_06400 [Spirochaetes bacterium GWE1_32_154]OHD48843.1 MAG: hypothetical protein A2015_03855 [Spirochaetes bacterium GWF1_31_7]OHD78296.1 MAG: hypothetical protein A2355_02830 [Spirochaetes bacterium RIFOXYB1_FULL_32_8]
MFNVYANGLLNTITISGHAEFDKKGKDIVCAAVSVLIQTFYMTLKQLDGLIVNLIDDKVFSVTIENDFKNYTETLYGICSFLLTGIYLLKKNYPDYIKIINKGVNNGTS